MSDHLNVTLQSRGRHGRVSRTIRVSTNDAQNRNVTLTCEGSVRGAFSGAAPRANFGRIERDFGSQTQTLILRRGDAGPITPELSTIRSQNVSAALREVKAGEHYELDVTLSPPWPNKRLTTSFNVKTGIAQAPEESVLVTAEIVPRVRTVPDRFNIARMADEPSESTVSVVWDGDAPQKIVNAEVSDERLSVRLEEEGERQKVVLAVPAGYDQPRRSPHVTLTTDDQEVKILQVPIRYKRAGKGTSTQRVNKPVRAGKTAGAQPRTATTATQPPPKTTQNVESAKPAGTAPQGPEKTPSIKKVRQLEPVEKDGKTASKPEEPKKKIEDK